MYNNYENMEPANEALGILKTVVDTMEKKCEMIKSELDDASTAKEQIEVIKKLKKELIRFKGNIQKTKPNFFDTRCYKRIKYILGTAIFTIMTPFTAGISLFGAAGCIALTITAPSADIVKADAIKSIDAHLKNCDAIIKYLEENVETAAEEGMMQDFIDNKKHNHEMRKEARQVKKEYKYFKHDKGWDKSSRTKKYDRLSNTVSQIELSKRYPTQIKSLSKAATALKKEFDDILKGTGVRAEIGKFDITDNEKFLNVTVYVDPDDLYREIGMNDGKYNDLDSELNATLTFFKRKYRDGDISISSDQDDFMVARLDIRIPENNISVESFMLFCDENC